MKNLHLSFLVLLVLTLCQSSTDKYDSFFKVILADQQLEHQQINKIESEADLRFIRNSIYAKYGYIFKSNDLDVFFRKRKWYIPKLENVDPLLTENDQVNISLITEWESERKLDSFLKEHSLIKLNENMKKFVGIWQDQSVLAAGWTDTFSFYPNGKYIQRFNQMDCGKRIIGIAGSWKIENEQLILQEHIKQELVGGKTEKSSGSCASDIELLDAKLVVSEIVPKVLKSFPFILPLLDESIENPKLTTNIDNVKFWKFDNDPKNY